MGIFSTISAATAANLTNQGALVRPWININNIPTTSSWSSLLKSFFDDVCPKKTPTSSQTDRHRFNLLQDSADGKFTIASTLGFDKSGNINTSTFNDVNNINKATYLLFVRGYAKAKAIKTPVYEPLNTYKKWLEEINKIRHKHWEINKTADLRRLTLNGEREQATSFKTLSSETLSHAYNTLHKMQTIAGMKFNPRELELMFDGTVAKLWGNEVAKKISLKNYLVSKVENDYYTTWNLLGTFYPHIPGPTFPIASVVKTINLSSSFNPGETGLYIPGDEDYKNPDQWIKGNYIKYPRIKSSNDSTNKVTISGYKPVNETVYIPIRVAPDFWWKLPSKNYMLIRKESDYMFSQYITVDPNNTNLAVKTYNNMNSTEKKKLRLYSDSNRTTYYWPDFNNGEYLADESLYQNTPTSHYVKIIRKVEYDNISVIIPGGSGIKPSDLLGARVKKRLKQESDGSWYYIEYTNQSSTNTVSYGSRIKSSGLTMGAGLDMGTSQRKKYAPDNVFSFNGFLNKVCANWNQKNYFGEPLNAEPKSTDTNNRAIIMNASGKKAVAVSDYWVKNRRLFELIDLNDSFGHSSNQHKNYGNMLWKMCDLMTIYIADQQKLKAFSGLHYDTSDLSMATEFEKYIALHAAWAGADPDEFSKFVEAVNSHDYITLKLAISTLKIQMFAKNKIEEILNKQGVKDYYENEHFNNI